MYRGEGGGLSNGGTLELDGWVGVDVLGWLDGKFG